MNISLKDFTQTDYENYLSYSIDEYAEANLKSGRWNKDIANVKAKEQFDTLLKNGLKSEGHFFWKICLDGKDIGVFWFHQNQDELEKVFVYDTKIAENYQSQGIGTYTFSIIQNRLKLMGVSKISLHVFAHNTGAVRLYERLGFQFASHNMFYMLNDH